MVVTSTLIALAIKYCAECNLFLVFFAYFPVWLFILPFAFSALAALLFGSGRTLVLSSIGAIGVLLLLGPYHFTSKSAENANAHQDVMSVMTYNRGQGSDETVRLCAERMHPDVAALQDAGRRLPKLLSLQVFQDYRFHAQDGEFALLSRWPILAKEPLEMDWPGGAVGRRLIGMRYVIQWLERRIVIYNIHLPTPRDLLSWYGQRGTFMYGLIGIIPGTSFHGQHQRYLLPWSARVEWAARVKERIQRESDPVILMGDLNMPPVGLGYQKLRECLQDSHPVAGAGAGFTFPGNSKKWGRWVSPWIRIDYIMTTSDWEILSCSVRKEDSSQHYPVVSAVRIKAKESNHKNL